MKDSLSSGNSGELPPTYTAPLTALTKKSTIDNDNSKGMVDQQNDPEDNLLYAKIHTEVIPAHSTPQKSHEGPFKFTFQALSNPASLNNNDLSLTSFPASRAIAVPVNKNKKVSTKRNKSGSYTSPKRKVLLTPINTNINNDGSFKNTLDKLLQARNIKLQHFTPTPEQRYLGTLPSSSSSGKRTTIKGNNDRVCLFLSPTLPQIIYSYLQLLVNLIIVGVLCYLAFIFITSLKEDFNRRIKHSETDLLIEIAECTRQYVQNHCQPHSRVPAVVSKCQEWELCMSRTPDNLSKVKVSAQSFAQIINSFVDEFSVKSMVFIFLMTVGVIVVSNLGFVYLQRRHRPPSPAHYNYFKRPSPSRDSFIDHPSLPPPLSPLPPPLHSDYVTPNRQRYSPPRSHHHYSPRSHHRHHYSSSNYNNDFYGSTSWQPERKSHSFF